MGVGAGYDGGSEGGCEARLGAGGGGAYAAVLTAEPSIGCGTYGSACEIELALEWFELSLAFCKFSI